MEGLTVSAQVSISSPHLPFGFIDSSENADSMYGNWVQMDVDGSRYWWMESYINIKRNGKKYERKLQ